MTTGRDGRAIAFGFGSRTAAALKGHGFSRADDYAHNGLGFSRRGMSFSAQPHPSGPKGHALDWRAFYGTAEAVPFQDKFFSYLEKRLP
jgi:hypothetical protein